MHKSMEIMGYDVFVDDMSSIMINPNKKQVISTINPHSYVIAKGDKEFEEALRDSDILLPDGNGIVLAAKQIHKKKIQRMAGSDLHHHLLRELNKIGGSIFYVGSSRETLDLIDKRIFEEYPFVSGGSYSPPFKAEFSQKENDEIISRVNAFVPDVLFVGMTAPKQEKWLHANKDKMNFGIASSVGAVFDFYAGTVRRPKQLWLNLQLEWLVRFLKDPIRLWKRNFISAPQFLLDMLLYKNGIKGGSNHK